jgi:hypothetical protein
VVSTRFKVVKPRICSSHLLRLVNPCCNACFTILFLNIIMIMPASQNHSNYAFRFGLRRLATIPTAKSGLEFSLQILIFIYKCKDGLNL